MWGGYKGFIHMHNGAIPYLNHSAPSSLFLFDRYYNGWRIAAWNWHNYGLMGLPVITDSQYSLRYKIQKRLKQIRHVSLTFLWLNASLEDGDCKFNLPPSKLGRTVHYSTERINWRATITTTLPWYTSDWLQHVLLIGHWAKQQEKLERFTHSVW